MLFRKGSKGGFLDKGPFEQIWHEVREGHAGILGKGFPGRGNSQHKGLESGTTLVFKGPQTGAALSKASKAK